MRRRACSGASAPCSLSLGPLHESSASAGAACRKTTRFAANRSRKSKPVPAAGLQPSACSSNAPTSKVMASEASCLHSSSACVAESPSCARKPVRSTRARSSDRVCSGMAHELLGARAHGSSSQVGSGLRQPSPRGCCDAVLIA
eukprot:scaffold22447_cov70-Phaeocystis_antarctica.AAC.4